MRRSALSSCTARKRSSYDGPPFIWDEKERRHLRARLDALYFHLYGLSREDAGYVLNTFPIVRQKDEAATVSEHGTGFGYYHTRDLILAYMNALAAGDTETVVASGMGRDHVPAIGNLG